MIKIDEPFHNKLSKRKNMCYSFGEFVLIKLIQKLN